MTPRDFALLAQEAYTAMPDIGIANSASRAIVRQTAGGLVVAFPGTDNVPCWLADLDIRQVSVAGVGEVHRGFWQAWQAIAPAVTSAVGAQAVTLVGHSLGAAIAIMAAVSMTLAGKPPAAVYGFEPPRVSSGMGVRTLLSNVHVRLYKNGNDIVPDVPLGLSHAALLTQIGRPALPIANVQDHMIDRVIAALGA
ncbi:lipase family protein [Paraburkholderia youngii]|uniref:Lipase family protein n=1 Tax=Paraburkholderia youngii TaxID=2782701 RepID=A0ABX2NPR2_9BURK|nr:lipase family protein [Paraburkholderia youngii]NVI06342.1 lipase family protein [Paraburkholderia youngii]